ncbi:MAG: hypothetical protein A3G18_01490 [Rhodospirillales bacterium RIFCSPLOWO2_12_FULL_58_28]|nr:MAG: hypothetical protein A3H92_08035 [Rhodospirillales bacterium RIFCSPLOWO2_02_FULL_58_16]OHC78969.1 MAG: hypothetical protein A3G18_01490 [Rhodospirillales bacterium RIFCSPLOWO2_12_FULL_58_28]
MADKRTLLFDLTVPPVMLLVPFVAFVRFHSYDLSRPELILSGLLLACMGPAFSGLILLRPHSLRPALLAVLLLLFADLQFRPGNQKTASFFSSLAGETLSPLLLATAVVAGLIICFMATWLLRRHLGFIFLTTFGVMLIGALILPVEAKVHGELPIKETAEPGNNKGVILHLILDEHIGIEGIPVDIPGGAELKRELIKFYDEFGFRLYGRVFSEYSQTDDSLSSMLGEKKAGAVGENLSGIDLRSNVRFDKLSGDGYKIRVYQTDLLNFCAHRSVDYCFVYPVNSVGSLMDADLAASAKARVILGLFFSESLTYNFISILRQRADRALGGSLLSWEVAEPTINPLPSIKIIDRVMTDLRRQERGAAYLAHILLPHYSYIFDQECRIRADVAEWLKSTKSLFGNTPQSRNQRYRLYFDQVRCTYKKLDALFNDMRENKTFGEATIIIHGDHGSRIALTEPRAAADDSVSDADLVDTFSTLFAVKMPGAAEGYEERTISLQDIFAELMLEQPTTGAGNHISITPMPRKKGDPFTRKPFNPSLWPGR